MSFFKVTVPVKVQRVEEIEWVFEVDSEVQAERLKEYIEKKGLVSLQPDYEEVLKIVEDDVIETHCSEVEIEKIIEGE